MEYKSKCTSCGDGCNYTDAKGRCNSCIFQKDFIELPKVPKKNTGLTLSEIAADTDVLEFENPRFRNMDRESLGKLWPVLELAATDWVVTKRKSDEVEKGSIVGGIACPDCFRMAQEKCELQKENEKLKAQLDTAEREIKTLLPLKDKMTWKRWPNNKPEREDCVCVIRIEDSENSESIAYWDGIYFSNNTACLDKDGSFEFLELP